MTIKKDDHFRIRAHSRVRRRELTDVWKAHGVTGDGYWKCTDGINKALLGGEAWRVRLRHGLPRKVSLRDHMDTDLLCEVILTERIVAERIQTEMPMGNRACAEATNRVAMEVSSMLGKLRRKVS